MTTPGATDSIHCLSVPGVSGNGSRFLAAAQPNAEPLPAADTAADSAIRNPQSAMARIIRPSARDRWQGAAITQFTPDRVESTIRSAFAGNLVAVWELYDLMEATWPRLQKNLNELKDDVASSDWTVQPWSPRGKEASPEAQRRAELFDQAIWSMTPEMESDENDFRATVKDLLDAWGKGVSILEIDWQQRSGLWMPRATQWVHPRFYGYPFDGGRLRLNVREIRQTRNAEGGTRNGEIIPQSTFGIPHSGDWSPFPPGKFLIGIAKVKSGHPVGGALLRALAWWWCAANFSAEWLLQLAQIFGLPIRWGTYDPNASASQIQQICDMLENMGTEAWAAFPAGTTLELKEPSKSGDSYPQAAMIDRADKQCDILVLGQTGTTEVGGVGKEGGSFAATKVHAGVLGGRKKAAFDWTAARLQQLARAFCRWNFGDESECPYFVGAEEETDAKLTAETFEIAGRAGVRIPAQYAHDKLGIPMPKKNEEVLEPRGAQVGTLSTSAPSSPLDKNGDGEDTIATNARGPLLAKSATDQIIDRALENLSGVQAKWLGGVRPHFQSLMAQAADDTISDEEFIAAVEKFQRDMPELFAALQPQHLENALYDAMSAGVLNGALAGHMKRRAKTAKEAKA